MTKAKFSCVDCGCDITEKNKGAKYPSGKFKCIDCYETENGISQKCEVYSRVVGYLRPVQQWNKGKVSEYKRRKNYKSNFEDNSLLAKESDKLIKALSVWKKYFSSFNFRFPSIRLVGGSPIKFATKVLAGLLKIS